MNCWQILGIEKTEDKRAIKRAYAKLIKQNNPEDKPVEFQAIREAYDQALLWLQYAEYDREQDQSDQFDSELNSPLNSITKNSNSEKPSDSAHLPEPPPLPELSEKEKTRNTQIETIDLALDQLIKLLEIDEKKAIEDCTEKLSEEYFQALDVRYEFEGRLIIALLRSNLYRFEFLLFLAQEFNWDINLGRPNQLVIGHFDDDARYSGAFYKLTQPFIFDLIKRDFKKTLANWHPDEAPAQFDRLEQLLFLDTQQPALEQFCKSKRNKKLIQSAYQYFTRNQFITDYSSIVPESTTQWLIDQKILKSQVNNPPEVASEEPSSSKKSSMPFWVVWLILFVVIRGAFTLINDNKNDVPIIQPTQNGTTPNFEEFITNRTDRTQQMQQKADAGDAASQLWIGLSYLRGDNNLPKDNDKAFDWIQRAADQDHPRAQEVLGILYYTGEAGRQDDNAAIDYLTWASSKDQADATYWLSRAFREGRAVGRDQRQAEILLQKSVDLESLQAMRAYGLQLIYTQEPEKDIDTGIDYLQQAAIKGDIEANYRLAHEYLRGTNVNQDYKKAANYLNSLYEKNIPIVWFWLSQLYRKGLGVQTDFARSELLLSKAKQQANPQAVNEFSWQLATLHNFELRNGNLAVELMEDLLKDPNNTNHIPYVDTLAAAYAEAGDFDNAVREQRRAIQLLPINTPAVSREGFEHRLALYQRRLSYTSQ